MKFSIPHSIDVAKLSLNPHKTIIFRDIPSENDVKRAVVYQKENKFEYVKSVVLCLSDHLVLTVAYDANLFFLTHEYSLEELGCNYSLDWSNYDELVKKIKQLIDEQINYAEVFLSQLKRIRGV